MIIENPYCRKILMEVNRYRYQQDKINNLDCLEKFET